MRRIFGVMLLAGVLASCGMEWPGETKDRETSVVRELMPVMREPNRLAIGHSVVVGLKDDGTLWSWGVGVSGALGNGSTGRQQLSPAPIAGMTDFIEVSGLGSHFLALRKDGTVWSWGDNEYGQLGYPTERNFSATPAMVPGLQGIISVAAGAAHSLAIDKDGVVYAFGKNESSKLGIGSSLVEKHIEPLVVGRINNAVRVIAGVSNSALLTMNGTAYLWGNNRGRYVAFDSRKEVEEIGSVTISGVRDVSFGYGLTCLLMRNGDVFSSGFNNAGQLAQGDFRGRPNRWVKAKGLPYVEKISADGMAVMALDESGGVWEWGAAVLGPPPGSDTATPVEKKGFKDGAKIVDIYMASVGAAAAENGSVYFWGADRDGMRGTGRKSTPPSFFFGKRNWVNPQKSLWTSK